MSGVLQSVIARAAVAVVCSGAAALAVAQDVVPSAVPATGLLDADLPDARPASGVEPGAAPESGFAPPAAPPVSLFGRAVLDEAALSAHRGGSSDMHLSKIVAGGTVSDTWVADVSTGHNIITDGAFANAAGMPMSIQNSGNGVLIQNAVIVNVEMR